MPLPAVHDLNLELSQGEILALLGPSGCGKTTTLRLIAGFERPDSGEVYIGNKMVAGSGAWVPAEKRGVGLVFQEYALFPHMTVTENVSTGLHGKPPEYRKKRIQEALELVGLSSLGTRYPYQLSGGQQQRVALARAIAPDPTVLLLDEPFSNLDPDLRSTVRAEVEAILRKARISSVIVTHDQEEAFALADRVAVLNAGKIQQIGTPEEIYRKPAGRFVAGFVGRSNFLTLEWNGQALKGLNGLTQGYNARFSEPDGSKFELLVRPHQFVEQADGIPAEVLSRRFIGPDSLYRVRLLDNDQLIEWQTHALYHPGDRVSLGLNLDNFLRFPID
jgi:iron(III) transport system ATP-binding protein